MSDIFAEVDQELREDRLRRTMKRNLPAFIAACVAIVLGVGGLQLWRSQERAAAEAASAGYAAALQRLDAESPAAAATALALFADGDSGGYKALALLRAAAIEAEQGRRPEAVALYERLAGDDGGEPLYRELAVLLLVRQQVDSGDIATLRGRIAPLAAEGKPWRPAAQEVEAILAMRSGDMAAARSLWQRLADSQDSPADLRARAAQMLRALPDPGAS